MVASEDELLSAVDAAFEVTGRRVSPWPDPHHGVMPTTNPEEYSRWTDPAKWRIVGARADAWMQALVDAGLAQVETDATVGWQTSPGALVGRVDRLIPAAAGAIPLVVARTGIGIDKVVGNERIILGAGDPAIWIDEIPDCGCDACDMGSDDVLRALNEYVFAVVSGEFRHLSSDDETRNSIGVWRTASGEFRRDDPKDLAAYLERYAGWDELRGTSWLGDDPAAPSS